MGVPYAFGLKQDSGETEAREAATPSVLTPPSRGSWFGKEGVAAPGQEARARDPRPRKAACRCGGPRSPSVPDACGCRVRSRGPSKDSCGPGGPRARQRGLPRVCPTEHARISRPLAGPPAGPRARLALPSRTGLGRRRRSRKTARPRPGSRSAVAAAASLCLPPGRPGRRSRGRGRPGRKEAGTAGRPATRGGRPFHPPGQPAPGPPPRPARPPIGQPRPARPRTWARPLPQPPLKGPRGAGGFPVRRRRRGSRVVRAVATGKGRGPGRWQVRALSWKPCNAPCVKD